TTENNKNSAKTNIFGEKTNPSKFTFGFFDENIESKKEKTVEKNEFKSNFAKSLEKIENGKTGLFVFGNNSFGTLGLGPNGEADVKRPFLQKDSLRIHFVSVACGSFCMAAIDSDGDVWTWGPVSI
ncbi:hypothetical protein MHBO_003942, partial [Bonamia ostreae]